MSQVAWAMKCCRNKRDVARQSTAKQRQAKSKAKQNEAKITLQL
jgi:hypothetical protein